MKIVMIGQAAFGKAVMEAICDTGRDQIGAVFCSPDREGRPVDALKEAALERGIPVLQPGRFRSARAIEQFKGLRPDLCVMAYVTDIVPEEMLNAPAHGTIQYHPSLLPKHRGPSSINWPIILGETVTGISIFWPDQGLDTGPVLLQKEVTIGPDDTVGSLYFDHLFPMGVEAMLEAIDLVRAGSAPRIAQDETAATYEGWCRTDDAQIDWTRPVADIYNLIRGCNPQPGAHTAHKGEMLKIFDAERHDAEVKVAAGEVIAVGDDGIQVAAAGGFIRMKRVQRAGSGKIPAGEYARSTGLKAGDRLR